MARSTIAITGALVAMIALACAHELEGAHRGLLQREARQQVMMDGELIEKRAQILEGRKKVIEEKVAAGEVTPERGAEMISKLENHQKRVVSHSEGGLRNRIQKMVEEGKISEEKADEMMNRVDSNMRDARGRVESNVQNRGDNIHTRRSLIQKKIDSGELTSEIGQQLLERLDKRTNMHDELSRKRESRDAY